ncbi:MAG TPA: hypothetical protein DEP51_03190 [Clostridiales bacterium]|nr:hypothetical protein [Clostridiales bacterium]
MKQIEIYNEDLKAFFGTSQITREILLQKNYFPFYIPLNSRSIPTLEELNKVIEFFDDVQCTIGFSPKNPQSHAVNMEKGVFEDDSNAIIEALEKTSTSVSKIELYGYFKYLSLPNNLMNKFTKLDTLVIHGSGENSSINTLSLPPNLSTIKLYNLTGISSLDTSQVKSLSDLVLFLDDFFLLDGKTNLPFDKIENLDLTDNTSDRVLNLNNLQQRFPNLKNLKMHPDYKFLGPLSKKEISFLVKVAGQIKIENTYDNLADFFIKDYIPFEIKGIKKIGNIFYDPKKIKLKPIELDYKKYKNISDKSRFKNAFVKINIKNMSELSTEEAIKLKEQTPNCQISVREVDNNLSIYSLNDYILMSQRLDKILSGINPNSSELEQYSYIYNAMYAIFYNDAALDSKDPEFIKSHPYNNFYASCLNNSSRNLLGALKYNQAVCSGFASAIHNACARQGLKSIIVGGCFYTFVDLSTLQKYDKENHRYTILKCFDSFHYLIKDREALHAWNLIQINGAWYNSDSSSDVNRIREGYLPKYFLFSDAENIQRCCKRNEFLTIKCHTPFPSYKLAETFPSLQPEPPVRIFTLSQNQFKILKKVISDYNNPLRIMTNAYKEISGFRRYKKSKKKYPIPLNPPSDTPERSFRENLIIQEFESPRGMTFTDDVVYPKDIQTDRESEL